MFPGRNLFCASKAFSSCSQAKATGQSYACSIGEHAHLGIELASMGTFRYEGKTQRKHDSSYLRALFSSCHYKCDISGLFHTRCSNFRRVPRSYFSNKRRPHPRLLLLILLILKHNLVFQPSLPQHPQRHLLEGFSSIASRPCYCHPELSLHNDFP